MPFEFIDYVIYNYNHNAIPKETLTHVLDWYRLSEEDVSDRISIRRFFTSPYRRDDPEWIEALDRNYNVSVKDRIKDLARGLETS